VGIHKLVLTRRYVRIVGGELKGCRPVVRVLSGVEASGGAFE
jgi:hypothetical protein